MDDNPDNILMIKGDSQGRRQTYNLKRKDVEPQEEEKHSRTLSLLDDQFDNLEFVRGENEVDNDDLNSDLDRAIVMSQGGSLYSREEVEHSTSNSQSKVKK